MGPKWLFKVALVSAFFFDSEAGHRRYGKNMGATTQGKSTETYLQRHLPRAKRHLAALVFRTGCLPGNLG